VLTGLTGVVQVKDHDRLEATLNKLIALYQDSTAPSGAEQGMGTSNGQNGMRSHTIPRIRKAIFAGEVLYYLEVGDQDVPLAPAWCLTKKELIVSTFPQNIKAYLLRGKDHVSLAAAPEVAAALEQGATALSFCDTRKVAEFAYPMLCVVATKFRQASIPLDASIMPSATAIFPHLQPSVNVVRQTSAGIELESHGSLAGVGGGALLPIAAVGWFGVRAEAKLPAAAADIETERAAPGR
jgi:hypothetical protein